MKMFCACMGWSRSRKAKDRHTWRPLSLQNPFARHEEARPFLLPSSQSGSNRASGGSYGRVPQASIPQTHTIITLGSMKMFHINIKLKTHEVVNHLKMTTCTQEKTSHLRMTAHTREMVKQLIMMSRPQSRIARELVNREMVKHLIGQAFNQVRSLAYVA